MALRAGRFSTAASGMASAAALGAVVLVAVAVAVLAGPVEHLAALYGSQFHLQGLEIRRLPYAFWGCRSPWAGWAPGLRRRGISAP